MKNRGELLFSEWLEDLAGQYGDRPALSCGLTITYTQLLDASRRCAARLIGAGVQKGDRVLVWAINGIDWVVEFFGITMAGGVATLMNYGLNAEDVTQLAKNVGATWALIGGNKVSAVDPMGAAKAVIMAGVPMEHILRMDELLKASLDASQPVDMALLQERISQINPRDTQFIIFTTGTTSLPKAVQLSSASALSDVCGALELLQEEITVKCCNALPLFHSFGMIVTLVMLENGSQCFLLADIKPQPLIDMVHANQIDLVATVGAIYGMVTALPDFAEKIAGRLKTCIVGGGFTTPTEMMRVENALGGGKLLIGYGQTECSPVISVNVGTDPLERRAVSVGRILPNIEVRIWREGIGFLSQGEIGEVLVKGPITMNGYLGLNEEEQPFDSEGWLHTGDLGMIAEDGLLQLAGRIKDIIIRSGENISPSEIEKVMMEEECIREVKVMGAPHPIWGESVEACVVINGEELDEKALRESLRARLSAYKIPTHFFLYKALPLNANGKLDQRGLKADMLEKLRSAFISNALNEGLRMLSIQVRNRAYAIAPVCDLIQGLAEQLGFRGKKVYQIRISVEEMLTERIAHAYDTNGDITMDVILMPHWMRVRFTDSGKAYRLDDKDASVSAKIILANVDAYGTSLTGETLVGNNLDWQYAEGFDINEYLMYQKEEGKA